MGMTMTQKTLADAAGVDAVEVGEVIFPEVNAVSTTDISVQQIDGVLKELGSKKIFDPDRISISADHFHLNNHQKELSRIRQTRKFAQRFKVENYTPPGRRGISHIHNSESGHVIPGDVVVSGDSHASAYGAIGAVGLAVGGTDLAMAMTLGKLWLQVPESIRVTFTGEPDQVITGKDFALRMQRELGPTGALGKAIEFDGNSLEAFPIGDRFIIADSAFECGALTGLMIPHGKALEYLADQTQREAQYYLPDDDAEFADTIEIDAENVEPLIREVGTNSIFGVSGLTKTVPIDQVIIGGCAGGQIEDLYLAAKVLKYREIHEDVRLMIVPGSVQVYRRLINEGLASIFTELGASIHPPTCGPCPESTIASLAPGERGVVTSRGRSYQNGSQVYSASVAVAAATAVTGELTDPRELIAESESSENGAPREY